MPNEEPDMPLKEQHKHKIKNKEKIEDLKGSSFFLALCVLSCFLIYVLKKRIYICIIKTTTTIEILKNLILLL